jgi:hypothetical protein
MSASQSGNMLPLCLHPGAPFTSLTKLDDEQWEKGLADGLIHPGMERGEAAALWYKSSRQKRHQSIAAEAHKAASLPTIGALPGPEQRLALLEGFRNSPGQRVSCPLPGAALYFGTILFHSRTKALCLSTRLSC